MKEAIAVAVSALVFVASSAGCSESGYVLHRSGNPPKIYIAKFDGMDSAQLNEASCNEFAGFVRAMSPETGEVSCSPEP